MSKDLLLREPEGAGQRGARETAPQISIGVNVNSRQRSQGDYEIELHLEAKAAIGESIPQCRADLWRSGDRAERAGPGTCILT